MAVIAPYFVVVAVVAAGRKAGGSDKLAQSFASDSNAPD